MFIKKKKNTTNNVEILYFHKDARLNIPKNIKSTLILEYVSVLIIQSDITIDNTLLYIPYKFDINSDESYDKKLLILNKSCNNYNITWCKRLKTRNRGYDDMMPIFNFNSEDDLLIAKMIFE